MTSILSTIITSSTVETLVAQAAAAALPVPAPVVISDAVLEIIGGLCNPRNRRPRGWSKRLSNREGAAFERRALKVDALLQGHVEETSSRPVSRVQDIILAMDLVQRALSTSEVEEERVALASLEEKLQQELEAIDPMTFCIGDDEARCPSVLSRHFAGMASDPGGLAAGDVEGHQASEAAREWEALGDDEEVTRDATQGVWGEDSTGKLAGSDALGSLASTEWDGAYQEALEAVDPGLVRIQPLQGPDAEAEVAEKIRGLFDTSAEVEESELLRIARCERPGDVAGTLARMGFEASPEDLTALRSAIFSGRVTFADDWKARTFWQSRQEAYAGLVEELIASCRSPQALVSLQGKLRFAMVVSKARSQGKTTTPQGQALPKGIEALGLPFGTAARLSNQAAFKAAWLTNPDANWLERQAKLTYEVGDAKGKAEAEAYCQKLETFLQTKVAKGLRLYAIGQFPEKVSATPEDADIFDGHNARQGSFLAEEAPVQAEAEVAISHLSIRELRESSLPGSWLEEQPWGCFSSLPSVRVGNRGDEVASVVSHRAVEELRPGVVKTLWAPAPWEISSEEAPALTGWDSLHALVTYISRSL